MATNSMNMTPFWIFFHQSLTAIAFFLLSLAVYNASFCNDNSPPGSYIQLCSRFSLTPILATPLSARASVTALHTPNVTDLAGAPRVLGTAKAVHDRDRPIREKQSYRVNEERLSHYGRTIQRRRRHLAHLQTSRRRHRLIAENQDARAGII